MGDLMMCCKTNFIFYLILHIKLNIHLSFFSSKPIPVSESKLNAVNQDLITGQLIDFNNQIAATTTTTTDVQMNIDDPLLSFNNNNNLTPLVASDSQDNRGNYD